MVLEESMKEAKEAFDLFFKLKFPEDSTDLMTNALKHNGVEKIIAVAIALLLKYVSG